MKKIDSEEMIIMRKNGLSYNEIRKKTGYSKATISKYCRNINSKNKYKIDKDKFNEAQEIYNKNNSLRQTSIITGISRYSLTKYLKVRKRIKRDEIEVRKEKSNRTKSWKRRLRNELVQSMGGKCLVCGYDRSIRALHFHHLNEKDKKYGISVGSISKKVIMEEINKCILVCSNCHCEIHDELYENGYSDIVNKLNLM